MKSVLLTGSALMLTAGVALAQTPNSHKPVNRDVPAQMSGSGAGVVNVHGTSQNTGMGDKAVTGMHGIPNNVHARTNSMSTSGESAARGQIGDHSIPNQTSGSMDHGTASRDMVHHSAAKLRGAGARAGVPYDASAGAYLKIADQAVSAHQAGRAHLALGRAETDLLTNSYVQGSVNGPISTPAISAVRGARTAVSGGQFSRASSLIGQAMNDMHTARQTKGGDMGRNQTNGGSLGGGMKTGSSM